MKFRFFFIAILSLFAVHSLAANGTMKGSGSAENPFQIEDYEDLKAIGKGAYLYKSNYILTEDIDASASRNEMCGEGGCNGFITIGKVKDAADSIIFWGSIDGQNHTISNLNIWLPCERDVAFIRFLGGSVTNLNFDNVKVTGRVTESNYVATVAAKSVGMIRNVHVTNGFVQGQNFVGGIVGQIDGDYGTEAVLDSVSFQGDIKGSQRVGGIAGQSNITIWYVSVDANIVGIKEDIGGIVGYSDGPIYHSRSRGTIVPGDTGVAHVGGIAGTAEGNIYRCVSTMDLIHSGSYVFDSDVGGIVGIGGLVGMSYALGTVEGTRFVGGIAGGARVLNSFAMGTVRGSHRVGGVNGSGRVESSYAANVVQGDSLVGGVIGIKDSVYNSYWNIEISGLDTSDGGTGLTTAQMMTLSSFAGWDTLGYWVYEVVQMDSCDGYDLDSGWCYRQTDEFVKTWDIDEGKSFPYLADNLFSKKTLIPIAVPTVAAKWQETPEVAAMLDVDGELFGRWLGWARPSETKDSLYFGYQVGYAVGNDTVWGTSSYMAVPNRIEISTYEELQKIGRDAAYPLEANYELTKDIDASSAKFEPVGDSVHAFSGTFDGKNHTIKNLEVGDLLRDCVGLFGYTYGANIKNLKLQNVKATGSWYVGALVGAAFYSSITNVISYDGDVLGTQEIGGLAGVVDNSVVNVVGTTGKVKGDDYVGGLVGSLRHSEMTDVFSMNIVKGHNYTAGIAGNLVFADLNNAYSASIIKTPVSSYGTMNGSGVYDGSNRGNCLNCYYDSTVAALDMMGGLPTETMLKQATFEGFNFDSVWTIQEGVSYPYFKDMEPMLPEMLEDDGTLSTLAGLGSAVNPYKIEKYEDLKYIGKGEYSTDLYYKLVANIDASASAKEDCDEKGENCKGFNPIPAFSGTFIGNGKRISNLYINRPDEDAVGLFRALKMTAKVSGLKLDTAQQFGAYYDQYPQKKAFIRGKSYVGGIAGFDDGATIDSIYVDADVYGTNYVGGIIGEKTGGSIARSASKGSAVGNNYVGGLVGGINKTEHVEDCYSVSGVMGEKYVGGLTGLLNASSVTNSFAAGDVYGKSSRGGLVGRASSSTATSAYYDSTLWGVTTTAAGELRTTRQMIKQKTYEGWDFSATWRIVADSTYPYLAWIGGVIAPGYERDTSLLHMAGSGTDDDPFLIKTYGDLKSIGRGRYRLSSVYRLANDIDASVSRADNVEHWYIQGFEPIGNRYLDYRAKKFGAFGERDLTNQFTGKFHGGGHAIKNLYMWADSAGTSSPRDGAFIANIGETGVVDSLSLTGMYFEFIGAALAENNKGIIDNVYIEGTFERTPTGMVWANQNTITNSRVKASIHANSAAGIVQYNSGIVSKSSVDVVIVNDLRLWAVGGAGGIVMDNDSNGVITECTAKVDLTVSYQGGGIAYGSAGVIEKSTASGVIVGITDETNWIGGIVGETYRGRVDHVFSSVDLTGDNRVGGIVGYNRAVVSNAIATGKIRSAGTMMGYTQGFWNAVFGLAGGLVGENDGVIRRSYYTGEVYNGSSLVGENGATIEDCYSTGNTHVDLAMESRQFNRLGFVRLDSDTAKVRAYSLGKLIDETSAEKKAYCLALRDGSSDEFYYNADDCDDSQMFGVGLTGAQMKRQKSFAAFDFDSVWYMKDGVTYPLLRDLPIAPVSVDYAFAYVDKNPIAKDVRNTLLGAAFVMDTTATRVLKLDSASEALLESLEQGKMASGTYAVIYRVGILLDADTLWGNSAMAEISVENTTGVHAREVAVTQGAGLGATFRGGRVALRFEIPDAGAVKFSLMDTQGRVVQEFDLGKRAAGAYSETLAADGISRGRYVGVLQVDGRVSGKILMLKN